MPDTSLSALSSPFLTNVLLPFLLVFVIIFALLEKTNLLGTGKRGANLIVALVIALLFIGVQGVVGFTVRLLPLVAVFIVILLGYFLIFGFIGIHESKGLKVALGVIFGIALVAAVLWATGLLDKLSEGAGADPAVVAIIIFVAIVGGAIALVLSTPTKPS